MSSALEAPVGPVDPPPSWTRPVIIGGALILAAILIFTRLGHNAFWDDEAATALGAKGIMQTGRNYALIDPGNVVAYGDGTALYGFSNQVEPLLAPYLTAASFEIFGIHPWSGRLPFALCGLGTVALALFWARRESWSTLAVLALGLVGNVSLILFSRTCRCYAASIFLSEALAYLYCRRRNPGAGSVAAFAALSILLFTTNYLHFIAFYTCLGLDYLLWQRKQAPLGWRLLGWLFLPQMLIEGGIAYFSNPLRTPHGGNLWGNGLWDKLTMFYWLWRDTDHCEFLCLPLLLAALAVGIWQRQPWLVRGCAAIAVYIAVITIVTPQLVRGAGVADVRYVTPIIPAAIAVEALAICALLRGRVLLQIGVACLVFGTNFLQGGFFFPEGMRSTLISYVSELTSPPTDPYTPTIAWINDHIPAGSSVLVAPAYATYPLMVGAPAQLYAWQFEWPARPPYDSLPLIHFRGQLPPDYLVAFGPFLAPITREIGAMEDTSIRYVPVATIDVFWRDLYRPEMFWHSFEPRLHFSAVKDGIHVFQRTGPPLQPEHAMK